MAANNYSSEIFTPLQAADFYLQSQDIIEHVQERVHGVYRTVELTSLPVPEGTTVRSETVALLGALSLGQARYDYVGNGFQMRASGQFVIPFASEEEWGPPVSPHEDVKPEVIFTTSVTATSEAHYDSDVHSAVLALDHPEHQLDADGMLTVGYERLMSIEGEPVRSKWLGRNKGYRYDPQKQAAVRAQIGGILTNYEDVGIDATITVETPVELGLLLGGTRALELRSRATYGHDARPATPPELILPTLRVIRALMAKSTEAASP